MEEERKEEREFRTFQAIDRTIINDLSGAFGHVKDSSRTSFEIASLRRQQQREVDLARKRSADVIASARQNARESMDRIRDQIREYRQSFDADRSPGGGTTTSKDPPKAPTSSSEPNFTTRAGRCPPETRGRRPQVTQHPLRPPEGTDPHPDASSQGGTCQLCKEDRPPPPTDNATYLSIRIAHRQPTGCHGPTGGVAMGNSRSVAGATRQRRLATTRAILETGREGGGSQGSVEARGGLRMGRGPARQSGTQGPRGNPVVRPRTDQRGGREPRGRSSEPQSLPRQRTSVLNSSGTSVAATDTCSANRVEPETPTNAEKTIKVIPEEGQGHDPEPEVTAVNVLATKIQNQRTPNVKGVSNVKVNDGKDENNVPVNGPKEEETRNKEQEDKPEQREEREGEKAGGRSEGGLGGSGMGARKVDPTEEAILDPDQRMERHLLAFLHEMEMIIQRREMESLAESESQGHSVVKPEVLDGLWTIVSSCKSAVDSIEDSGRIEVDGVFQDWMLDSLDTLGSTCYRFVMTLITELIQMSEKCAWRPEEHRLYMDAAMLTRRTCQKMMQPVHDEHVSMAHHHHHHHHHPSGTSFIQILSIHLQNLRVILALLALVNLRNPQMEGWSQVFGEALGVFVADSSSLLLIFEDSLREMIMSESQPAADVPGHSNDESGAARILADGSDVLNDLHRRMMERESGYIIHQILPVPPPNELWDSDDSDTGLASHLESINQRLSIPDFQNQYFYEDETQHHYHHQHRHPPPQHSEHPGYEEEEEEEDPQRIWLIQTNPDPRNLSMVNDSDISTDYESEGQAFYPGFDPYGGRFHQAEGGGHLSSEETRMFQSLMSDGLSTDPGSVSPPDSIDNYMLGFSVQVASHLINQTSDALNRMAYSSSESPPETFDIVINRSSETLLEDLIQLYVDAPRQLLHTRLNVVFEGEPGVDGGALSREFFCLLFRALVDRTVKNRAVFEGQRGHLLPAIDHVLSESKVFWVVGILVAQATANGCRGLPGLSPAVRKFLVGGARVSDLEETLKLATIDDVADLELRELLKKVSGRVALDETESVLWQNWLEKSGFSFVASEIRTDEAIKRILRYYVFESRMSQLLAIAEGMEELGWRPVPAEVDGDVVFPSGDETSLDEFFHCLQFNEPPPGHQGQSHHVHRAFRFFRKFCIELHDGKIETLRLSDLLHFFTGAPYLKYGINLTFMNPDQGVIYPQARTCSLELIIPTMHQTYEEFKTAFCQALQLGSYGFGFA